VLWTAYRVGIYIYICIYIYIYQLCVHVLWAFVCLDPMFEHCGVFVLCMGVYIYIYILYVYIYRDLYTYIYIYAIYHTVNSELCKASEGLGIGKCGAKLF